jgi:hypothetical protein
MRSDASLDQEMRMLESRIRDRRVALKHSFAELKHSASEAKDRVRARATSPLIWGAALAVGFVVARLAHRRRRPPPLRARFSLEREPTPQRRMLAALLSAALPLGLRIAQHALAPWIARTVNNLSARRRAYEGYRAGRAL